ncbi:MAG TPA: hypothetical protein PKZ38_01495 [Dermatophilaceae bacterium]|jgi:hypothetical protein|nr:hypothetical protein [Dermatophilaceae bacterium]HRB98718.1 hypothetical protein [Dermatophilaceae bacterium]
MTRKVIMSSRARSRVPRSLTYHREDGSRAILFDAASFASKTEGQPTRRISFGKRVEPIDRTLPARADQLPGLLFAVDLATAADEAFGEGVWTLESWELVVRYSLSEFSPSTWQVRVYSGMNDPRYR